MADGLDQSDGTLWNPSILNFFEPAPTEVKKEIKTRSEVNSDYYKKRKAGCVKDYTEMLKRQASLSRKYRAALKEPGNEQKLRETNEKAKLRVKRYRRKLKEKEHIDQVAKEKILSWFDQASADLMSKGIDITSQLTVPPTNIFNMDETGYPFDINGNIIEDLSHKYPYKVWSDTKTQVTVLGCCSASGQVLKPTIIFPGDKWTFEPWRDYREADFARTSNGRINSATFNSWLRETFLPAVDHLQRPVVLFLDGHQSHIDLQVRDFCEEHKITCYMLPAHSTHTIQPLDFMFHDYLKAEWRSAVQDYKLITRQTSVTQQTFSIMFGDVWSRTYRPSRIVSSWEASGLCPWDPERPDYTKSRSSRVYGKIRSPISRIISANDPLSADEIELRPDLDFPQGEGEEQPLPLPVVSSLDLDRTDLPSTSSLTSTTSDEHHVARSRSSLNVNRPDVPSSSSNGDEVEATVPVPQPDRLARTHSSAMVNSKRSLKLGPHCMAAGVTTELLMTDGPFPKVDTVLNGFVIELARYGRVRRMKDERIVSWIRDLSGIDNADLSICVFGVFDQRKNLASKKKTGEILTLESLKFVCDASLYPPPTDIQQDPIPASIGKCLCHCQSQEEGASGIHNALSEKKKQDNVLSHEISVKRNKLIGIERDIVRADETLRGMQRIVKQGNYAYSQIIRLKYKTLAQKRELARERFRVNFLEGENKKLQSELQQTKAALIAEKVMKQIKQELL